MGTCVIFDNLSASDWIAIIGMIVEALLTIWIVQKIAERNASKRVLQDLLICEIKEIREDYRIFFHDLFNDNVDAKLLLSDFKSRNIRNSNLLNLLKRQSYIKNDAILNGYMFDLLQIITDSDEFANSLKGGGKLIISRALINRINAFRTENIHIFSDLIIAVNGTKM